MAAVLRLESSGELSSTWVSLLYQSTLMGLLRNAGYFTPAHFLFAVYAAVAVTNRLSFQPHTKLHVLGQPRALANFQAKPYNPF